MKWLIVVTVLLQAAPNEPLVGRWDAEVRSRGGLGTWMTLSAAHTCSQTTGAMVDGTWQLTGDHLIRKIPEGPSGRVQTEELTIAIADRRLTMQIGQDKKQLTRVGHAPTRGPALVGVWSYPHPAGGTAYEDFEPDGRYLFRLPMGTISCTWRVDKSQLQLVVPNQPPQSVRWTLEGDRLTLEHDGQREVYRRETTILPAATVSRR